MSVEREIKVPVHDLEEVGRKLRQSEAREVRAAHWERNWILDRGEQLLRTHTLLRVRATSDAEGRPLGCSITVKALTSPAAQVAADAAGVKERVERQLEVASAGAQEVLALFGLLDYLVVRRYDKVRSVWRLAGHEIALDDTPMGPFVEVEGPDPTAVGQALGLPLAHCDVRSYAVIYDQWRSDSQTPKPGGPDRFTPADMLFPGGAPPGFAVPCGSEGEAAQRGSAGPDDESERDR